LLFLYRPRQTWMPYRVPREPRQQDAYNRQLQDSFAATRRVPAPQPQWEGAGLASTQDPIAALKELAQLHESGILNDEEFATAKAKVLGPDKPAS
jgi:Short C-terminal domain